MNGSYYNNQFPGTSLANNTVPPSLTVFNLKQM